MSIKHDVAVPETPMSSLSGPTPGILYAVLPGSLALEDLASSHGLPKTKQDPAHISRYVAKLTCFGGVSGPRNMGA